MVLNNITNCSSLSKFKNSIKSWKPNDCPCRLCKKYIAQADFIWFTSSFCNISVGKNFDFLYIFCIFSLHRMGKLRLVSYFVCFFSFLYICAVPEDFFGDLPKGLWRRCISLGISSLNNWMKFLQFVQWLSLSFVFYQFIYLFIIIINLVSVN